MTEATERKMGNPKGNPGNHPEKGSKYFIEPVRDIKDIQQIEKMLRDEKRNHLLFVMGINNGIRTGDLLKLKVKDVKDLKPGEKHYFYESKTKKRNFIGITDSIYRSLKNYLKEANLSDDDFLFKSNKGDKAITTTAVNQLISKWCKFCKIKGTFGAHTFRKTWAYQRRMKGIDWTFITKRLNHSSPAITMRYLGIEDKEVDDSVFVDEII